MTLRKFQHVSASSLAEATKLLAKAKGKATMIAGGTDLLGTLKHQIHPQTPEMVIDLKTIPRLNYVEEDRKGLRIGALTTLTDIVRHPLVKKKFPVLAEAARTVASPQIRNMGTIGGNICQEPRCWYYRVPDNQFHCLRKGGTKCGALLGENRYHSIFGSVRMAQPACATACPGHVEIPSYMSHLRGNDRDAAAGLILENNPIPAITGRVCPHFCESECNRTEFDEAVSIRCVERSVGDYILENAARFMKAPRKELSKSVAVVGSGPAGLSAAFYLRRAGYRVTVFDRMPEAGGMLTYCIPSYRLPKEVVQRQIAALQAMGIVFCLNAEIGGKGLTLKAMRKKFDHVFLATGAWRQKTLPLEKAERLLSGIDFLIGIAQGNPPKLGKKILVIGGGNVAVDVAISARRQGARQVTMVCLEARDIMPAFQEEIAQALEEGVTLLPSWGPSRILEKDGAIAGLELVRCTSVFDEVGRFSPSFDPRQKKTLHADQIILAIGQSTDLSYADKALKTERGLIVVADDLATSIEGVSAGGDVTSGPASVIHAIAAGRQAAYAIAGIKPKAATACGDSLEMHIGCQSKSQRAGDVQEEAMRCANCGCIAVNASDIAPVLVALEAKMKTTKRTLEAEEFFAALPFQSTVLDPDEIVTEVVIPAPKPESRQAYLKFRIRNAIDFPIVSLACLYQENRGRLKNTKIALGAVAPVPLRMKEVEAYLEGKPADEATTSAAGDLAVRNVLPLAKNKYKVQVVKALLKKALLKERL